MLVESQPGKIDFLPAWPADMPPGKIEGVALRGQITLKELSWKGKEINAVLRSGVKTSVTISAPGEIVKTEASSKATTNGSDGILIALPANRDVMVKIELK